MRTSTAQSTGQLINSFKASNENGVRRMVRKAEQSTNENVVKAIYPALDNTEALNLTMDNYRHYVAEYNDYVRQENKRLEELNSLLIKAEDLNEVQRQIKSVFIKKYYNSKTKHCPHTGTKITTYTRKTSLTVKEFNEQVTYYNEHYGNILRYEPLQTIKASAEQVFCQMMYVYSQQLKKRNAIYRKINIAERQIIPMFNACSSEVTGVLRNGIKSLNLCNKTIRNYRQRFEEAGIFIDYYNMGSGVHGGVLHHINPKILVVFDEKTEKLTVAENQVFTFGYGKNIPNLTMNIQEQLNNSEIKANVNNNSQNLCPQWRTIIPRPEQRPEHQSADHDPNNPHPPAPAPETRQDLDEKSKMASRLIRTLEPAETLYNDLSKGTFDNYNPIDIRLLQWEAYQGVLTSEEFLQILAQDFLKHSAKLYRGKQVFAGTWYNAHRNIMILFQNFTGKSFSKFVNVEKLQEYRWRLNYAYRYTHRHKEFNLLFPSEYFNPTRNQRQEGGFGYTRKAWAKHLKDIEQTDLAKAKNLRKSRLRKERINESKAVTDKIKMHLKGRLTLEALYKFVEKNHPNFVEHISELYHKMTKNIEQNQNANR